MKKIFDDRVLNLGFSISLFFVIIQAMLVIILFNTLPPFLPLYNQLPWGQPRLGAKSEFFIPLLIVIGIIIGNVVISTRTYEKMPLIARILSQTSLLISFLALFFTIRTILLIT